MQTNARGRPGLSLCRPCATLSSARRTKSAHSRKRTAERPAESHRKLACTSNKVCVALHRAARRQYGLLEKKKDYKLRADDFHKKEEALRRLRRKAEERNPDEFYFAMQGAQTRQGVHAKRCAAATFCATPYLASFATAVEHIR